MEPTDAQRATGMAIVGRWVAEFRESTQQLNGYRIGGDWWRLSRRYPQVTPRVAAAWADLGYLPGEAEPLITQGITPECAREMGAIATDVAGSREEQAMQEIDRLKATGQFVDPRRARTRQDPSDPDRYEVDILPEGRIWE